jgi:hypothetical protein
MARKTELGTSNFAVISESDSATFPETEYLHVETAGNLVVKNRNGTEVTFAVTAATMYPIGATALMTASSCGQVVGFWAE